MLCVCIEKASFSKKNHCFKKKYLLFININKMSNFAPIYSNTGGKNIINTLQRNHIIAVLNAKSIVKQSLNITTAHTAAPKLKKRVLSAKKLVQKSNGFQNNDISKTIKSPKVLFRPLNSTNPLAKQLQNPKPDPNNFQEVRSLLRNLITIDKKSFANIKNLKKTFKTQLKKDKKPKKPKNFYVSDFIGQKNLLKKKTLDKLLIVSGNEAQTKMQIPAKKRNLRCMSAKSFKKPNSKEKITASQNLLMLDQMIKNKNHTAGSPNNANLNKNNNELYEELKILFDANEFTKTKKKIMIHLVKNKIIVLADFMDLKKELIDRFGKDHEEDLKKVLEEIENHIFK